MKREKWKFQFKAEEVKAAAEKKLAWHRERKTWWEQKKEEVMTQIKTSGISIDESIVEELSKSGYSNTLRAQNFGGPQIRVDPELTMRLSECHTKVNEHREKGKQYESWTEVLAAGGTQLLTLDYEDYLFFYGK